MIADRMMLLGMAGASILALAAGSVLLLRAHARQTRLEGRLGAVVARHQFAERTTTKRKAKRRAPSGDQRMIHRLAGILGYSTLRQEASVARWWVVLPVALVLARVLAQILTTVAGEVAVFATPALWVMLSRLWWQRAEARQRALLYKQFPDTLAMIVRAVRVGIPVSEAIRGAAREQPAPTSKVMGTLSDQLAVGMPMEEALAAMADRCGVAEYRFFATTLTLQAQTGGGLAETLENLADVIRKRLALRERAKALAGEAQLSATILGVLPMIAGGALVVLNPEYIMVLINDPTGRKVLAAAILTLGAGVFTMRTMISRSLS